MTLTECNGFAPVALKPHLEDSRSPIYSPLYQIRRIGLSELKLPYHDIPLQRTTQHPSPIVHLVRILSLSTEIRDEVAHVLGLIA